MYEIHDLKGRDAKCRYFCVVTIQDGTEAWHEDTLEDAVYSIISAARTLNGMYIHESDITKFPYAKKSPLNVSERDFKILNDIHTGKLTTINPNHPILKYGISEKEAEWIVAIREGRAKLNYV